MGKLPPLYAKNLDFGGSSPPYLGRLGTFFSGYVIYEEYSAPVPQIMEAAGRRRSDTIMTRIILTGRIIAPFGDFGPEI